MIQNMCDLQTNRQTNQPPIQPTDSYWPYNWPLLTYFGEYGAGSSWNSHIGLGSGSMFVKAAVEVVTACGGGNDGGSDMVVVLAVKVVMTLKVALTVAVAAIWWWC